MAHAAAVALSAGTWLLAQAAAQAAALPDTIVTIQAPIEPGWFERFQEMLRALMTLAILVLTVAVVPAAWNFRKSYQKVSDLLDRVYADVNPLTHHAARIAENVDYVTAAVRADTQRASALLAQAEARLAAALERAEARARDFEALVDVAQHEAERTFVSAAATAAGVREGVASFRDDLAAALRVGPVHEESPLAARDDEAADAVGDDVALVDVRRVGAGDRPPALGTHPSSGVPAGDPSEDLFDGETNPGARRPAVGPRLRPRDRG